MNVTRHHHHARHHVAFATALLAATLALSAAPSAASAAAVSYGFTGVVDYDEADRGWTSFSGQFTFNSEAVDGIPDPSTAAYAHTGAPWGMTVNFDGIETVAIHQLFNVLISNNLGFFNEDQFGALAQDADANRTFSMTLWDFSGSVFGSDALPLPEGGLTMADFSWSEFRYESGARMLQGRLDSLACLSGCSGVVVPPPVIPEPGTWALTLAGLGAMGLLQRRRRTAR